MNKVIIVGAGINGLVAANYLVKNGFDVSVIEKKPHTGGACIKDTVEIENKKIPIGRNYAKYTKDKILRDKGNFLNE